MRTLLILPIILFTVQARAASSVSDTSAAVVSPATTNAPFALVPLTPKQINTASPFFTVDVKDPVILTTPPVQLEDLQIVRLWSGRAPLQQDDNPAIDIPTLTVFLPPTGKASGARSEEHT